MDLKISKAVEQEEMQAAQQAAEEAAKVEAEQEASALGLDSRTIGITAAVLLGIFVVATFGGNLFGDLFSGEGVTSAVVATVDQKHEMNIAGDLDPEEGYMYNDFSFVLHDGLWWTSLVKNRIDNEGIEIVKAPLHYGPQDVQEVVSSGELSVMFDSMKEVFISIDPSVVNKHYTLALSELNFNIVKGIGRKPIAACTQDVPECVGREIISCDNNPRDLPMIELALVEGSPGEISLQGNCIVISGDDETLVQAVDRWLLHWYSIMPLDNFAAIQ